MIKSSELRIGNWVKAPLGEIMKVAIIGNIKNPDYVFARYENGYGLNAFEPIELTPDILEKAGFKKWKEMHFQQWGYVCQNVIIEVNEDGTILYIHEPNITMIITSVHQLQNLFHSLTGQELQINL